MDFKYQGIILNKKDIGEVDRFYVVYTLEAGKIIALGKGVRNPNAKLAGHLEPVTYSEIFIAKTKGRGKITSAIAINNFINIKSSFFLLSRVFWVLGIIDRLIVEAEKDERIFELLLNYLEILEGNNQNENSADIISLGLIFKLLDYLGYRLEVEKCASCGRRLLPGKNFLSVSKGGVLCPECSIRESRKTAISDEAIKSIRIFLGNDIKNFSKVKIGEKEIDGLKRIVREMVEWIS